MTGVIALIVALAVASAVGAGVRRRAGKVRSFPRTDNGDSSGTSPSVARPIRWRFLPSGAQPGGTGGRPPGRSAAEVLTEGDLGAPLGERATLVQFSTEFCAFCGPTRELLKEIAAEWSGVAFVEVDAAERMDLTRRLKVFSTPTVLALRTGWSGKEGRGGTYGTIVARSAGKPDKAALQQAVRSVLDDGVRS